MFLLSLDALSSISIGFRRRRQSRTNMIAVKSVVHIVMLYTVYQLLDKIVSRGTKMITLASVLIIITLHKVYDLI